MGDRCWMELQCRREDMGVFIELGFDFESAEDNEGPVVRLVDQEANYAHAGDMPKDLPFIARNGEAGDYGCRSTVCDGKTTAEVSMGHGMDGFVVDWDNSKDAPRQRSIDTILFYHAIYWKVKQMFDELTAKYEQDQKSVEASGVVVSAAAGPVP